MTRFNLRREAAPHATPRKGTCQSRGHGVSISDEKPLHMRLTTLDGCSDRTSRFNLRREAAPHATTASMTIAEFMAEFQSQTRSRSTCDFSFWLCSSYFHRFQSQTRSRSTCDLLVNIQPGVAKSFQSQTRSRSTCDMPGRYRPCPAIYGFNLRREAAPHATRVKVLAVGVTDWFQSQTRSRSTCDQVGQVHVVPVFIVSISDEKPLHMRRANRCHCRCHLTTVALLS